MATVLGETRIRLLVDSGGAAIEEVELQADGEPFAALTEPPWELVWDAGPAGGGHTLVAVLRLYDGRTARATVRTSPLQIHQVEKVDLVNLYLIVRDGAGRYVTDLTEADFRILEDRVEQRIERFATTHKPLRVGIVLDSSRSMIKGDRLEKAKTAALEFLEILEQDDEATVVNFNDYVHAAGEFTDDGTRLAHTIRQAYPAGGTALYDAIWRTSRMLDGFDGRRVMVLLSDGRDEAANGFEPGSLHTLDEALDQALRSEVMIFPIGLGGGLEREYVRRWDDLGGRSNVDPETSLADVLRRLAASTGGRAIMSSSPGRLRRAFGEIAEDLRHQYSVAYISSNRRRDGSWRSIEVETPGRRLEVVARKGYYAPDARRSGRKSAGK
jgi:VWFA-related protein